MKYSENGKLTVFTKRRLLMYNYAPVIRCAKSTTPRMKQSKDVNVILEGSPSRILSVLRISLGMTIRPKSSTRRTIPVAFIYIPLLVSRFQWYCLQEMGDYAAGLLCCNHRRNNLQMRGQGLFPCILPSAAGWSTMRTGKRLSRRRK